MVWSTWNNLEAILGDDVKKILDDAAPTQWTLGSVAYGFHVSSATAATAAQRADQGQLEIRALPFGRAARYSHSALAIEIEHHDGALMPVAKYKVIDRDPPSTVAVNPRRAETPG